MFSRYPLHTNLRADLKSALWVSFWLFVLTKGHPDIIDQVIAWIGRY